MFPDPQFGDEDPAARVAWLREHRTSLDRIPLPGEGRTVERLRSLAALAAHDGSLARLAEGHLDAVAIREELGHRDRHDGLRAVWAARPELLTATATASGWRLCGRKAWCSGADAIDRALVTATAPQGVLLFDVAVDQIEFDDDWHPPGMRASDSRTGCLDGTVGEPLGPPDCYVDRAGFWHGGIGVAACWYGLARRLASDIAGRAAAGDDLHRHAVAGEVAAVLAAAGAMLGAAGRQIDEQPRRIAAARTRARTVRTAVEHAARHVLQRVVAADGATALCFEPDHGRALADLTVYLGQYHHGADAAAVPPERDDEWWTA